MDNVHTENQWNVKAAFLNGNTLHVANALYPLEVEETTHFAIFDFLGNITALCLSGYDFTGYRKVELTDFLMKSHLSHEVIDEFVHFGIAATTALASGERSKRYSSRDK